MDQVRIKLCEGLIQLYQTTEGEEQQRIRNQLFIELCPFIVRWMQAVLHKQGRYQENDELVSGSWDCYEFCLFNYKQSRGIPIPNHFYTYTKYYLLTAQQKVPQETDDAPTDDRGSCDFSIESFENVYSHFDSVKKFKNYLDPEYHTVFEDALMSMYPGNKNKVRRLDESPLSYYNYCEAKKVFKMVIDFLLRNS